MTIDKFLEEYSNGDEMFKMDFWSVIETLGQNRFQSVASQVLSEIPDAELILTTREIRGYTDGQISFGPKGSSVELGVVINYSLAYGQTDSDWYLLLKIIAADYIRSLKSAKSPKP
jgi:hypothetical protein